MKPLSSRSMAATGTVSRKNPPSYWTAWETAGILVAAVVAYAYWVAWRDLPVLHDAAGYLRAAGDIFRNGLFSKYDLSDIRTYAWPWILSWLLRLSQTTAISVRSLAFELELTLHIGACLALRRMFLEATQSPRLTRLVFLSILTNPLVLIYTGYLLTESISFSVAFVFLGICVLILSPAGRERFATLAARGSFLLGMAMVIRPGNVSLAPVWAFAMLAAIFRHRPRARETVKAAVLTLVCGAIPLAPQFCNNLTYYKSPSPLVANDFTADARWRGIRSIKYATCRIPKVNEQVFYENPFGVNAVAVAPTPGSWYLSHPIAGAATLGLHIFNLLDQDFPFPYNRNLTPWYYPWMALLNLLVVSCSMFGLRFAAPAATRAGLGPIYSVALITLAMEQLMHIPYAVETRWGVASLAILYVFATWFLADRLPKMGWPARIVCLTVILFLTGAGGMLSAWVRRQAPAIRAAQQAQDDARKVPGLLQRMTPGRFVSGTLNNWTMFDAYLGGEGQAMLVLRSARGGFSGIIHPVTIEKNADYQVEFEARAQAGMTEELSVDLFAGPHYDQPEQNSFYHELGRGWTTYKARWNSGPNAPHEVWLRFVTVSRNPIEIRNVTFVQVR
jgi:hypothetical protein